MKPPKKIAIVSNTSWSVYNFRLGLIRRLKEMGHEVHVIAPYDSFSTRLIAEGFSFHPIYINNYSTNPIHDLKTFFQLKKVYQEHRFDFIFHYTIKPNIYGTLVAKWYKTPSIAVTTGLGQLFSHRNKVVKWFSKMLYKVSASYSQEVWFLNNDDKNSFIKEGIIAEAKSFLLPGEGINTQQFSPKELYRRIPPKKQTFLYAGRVLWDKGMNEFVKVAQRIKRQHPNTEFQILGFISPSHPNAVSVKQIEDWHKKGIINYLGDTDDVRPYLEDATCLVLPSYGEGLPRVMLEGMSMAKPLIASNVPGCRDVVDHGWNGFLCEPKNVQDLSWKIQTFLELSHQEKEQMGLNSRKKVLKQFDEEIIIQHYIRTLRKYLGTEPVPEEKLQLA